MEYSTSYLITTIIVSIVFGFITKAITSSRGGEGGFWWGFFLNVIGIIVVAVRPMDTKPTNQYSSANSNSLDPERWSNAAFNSLPPNGWTCSACGKTHYAYESGCSCGASRFASSNSKKQPSLTEKVELKETPIVQSPKQAVSLPTEEIKKYKELLDMNIITEEEFALKKKELLGL